MDDAVRALVRRTGAVTAGIAAVLSPIPFADEIVLVPVYGVLTLRIGRAHRLSVGTIPWRPVGSTVLAGLLARATVNLAFAFVPGVAAVANAVSAVALTELLGTYLDETCAAPERARTYNPLEFATMLRERTRTAQPVPAPG